MTSTNDDSGTTVGTGSLVQCGLGADLASATTLSVTDSFHYITGTATITTINFGANAAPTNPAWVVLVRKTGATCSFSAGGNILSTIPTLVDEQPILAIWNGSTGWILDGTVNSAVALLNRVQQNFTTGQRISGSLGAGTGILRSDAQLETYGTTGAISTVQTTKPGTTTNEAAYIYGAYDSAGTLVKTASISSKWAVATASTGYGVLRLNATYTGGAADDVAIRIFGNHGVAIFGPSDTVGPGTQILRMYGTGYTALTQTGSNITGNFFDVLDVRDGTGTWGFILGYDSTSGAGVISGLASAPIAFWTFNGAAWGERVRISDKGSLVTGGTAALSTAATDGFLYIPSCAGAPVGTPTTFTGRIPIVYDSTNNFLYIYNSGWKKSTAYS